MAKNDEIQALIEPVIVGMGFTLWGIEYLRNGKFSTLRVFIDHEEGIHVDHCAEVSRQIGAVMDVEDPITGNYSLEVSSPGMDRSLFTIEQYAVYAGEWAEIKLRHSFEGRKNFKGVLAGIEDENVVISVEGVEFLLPIESVDRGRIIPNFK